MGPPGKSGRRVSINSLVKHLFVVFFHKSPNRTIDEDLESGRLSHITLLFFSFAPVRVVLVLMVPEGCQERLEPR